MRHLRLLLSPPNVGLLCLLVTTVAAHAQKAEPITLENVDEVGLLSETQRAAQFLQLGPGANELLFFSRQGVVVVDDQSFKVLRKLEDKQRRRFSFSKDRQLMGWIDGKKLMVRDEKSGETIEMEAGERPGSSAFSPDKQFVAVGDMIITGSEGEGDSVLRVFNAKTAELIKKIEISTGSYGALSPVFSPDGKTLAVGNRNNETKLFDTKSWQLRHTLPKRMTHEIAFSKDSKTLAAGYVDGTLALWDVGSGKALHMVDSGTHRIHSVAWNPAGDLLATAGPSGGRHGPNNTWIRLPGKVLLWNPKTLKVVKELMDVQWAGSVRFTNDGARIVATVMKKDTLDAGTRLVVWSTNAPAAAATTDRPKAKVATLPVQLHFKLPALAAPNVAISADGKRLAAPTRSDQPSVWDLTLGERAVTMESKHAWQIWEIAFSPDGQTIATASLDKTAKIWDAHTGRLLKTLEGHHDRVKSVTYSHNGKYVLTTTGKQWPYNKAGPVSARVWNVRTGKAVSEFKSHIDSITKVAFTRDDTRVLTSSDDHTVRLWEVGTGKELQTLTHDSKLVSAQFSDDESMILTSTSGMPSNYVKPRPKARPEAAMKLWETATGKELMRKASPQPVNAAFNTDDDQILTAVRGLITYWDAKSGKQLTTVREPYLGTVVEFCPTGKHFVVLPPEGPAELWSVAKKKQIRKLTINEPFRTFFSDDGASLYSLTRAGDFRVWPLDRLEENSN